MIDKRTYAKIVNLMPIICVDLCVKHGNEYLLVLRKNEPLKMEWWVPGGRLMKGEKIVDAISRKLEQELGLRIVNLVGSIEFMGIYEEVFDKSPYNCPIHTVSAVFLVDHWSLSGDVKLDDQSIDYKFGALPDRFIKNLKKI